jgi:phosphohistidine swiveling domain-containing protein
MAFIQDLHSASPELGGKARSLVRLSAAGLSTPAGFVVADAVFHALCPRMSLPTRIDEAGLVQLDRARTDLMSAPWPAGFLQELVGRLSLEPNALWSVRSSFASEDLAGGLGAGVYQSVVAVPSGEVEAALRQVLASALSAGAVAYALAHGLRPAAPPVSVLVHRYIRGDADGGAACDPEHLDEPIIQVRTGTLSSEAAAWLRAIVRALAQSEGAIEVEWVASGGQVVFLQLRPYQPLSAPAPWPGWDDLQAGESPSSWHWDQAHNPLPLSPVHAGLVALVDERCHIGIRQRVLGQYLFYATDSRPGPPPISAEEAPTRFASLLDKVESRLAKLGVAPALEDTLDLLLAVEEPLFGVIQPALRSARSRLAEFLRQEAPTALPLLPQILGGIESKASERRQRAAAVRAAPDGNARRQASARYLELFGDETPVWDVAVPTYGEILEMLEGGEVVGREDPAAASQAEQTAEGVESQLQPHRRDEWRQLLRLTRQAVGLGEDDDWLYARTQASIRRALLQLGMNLQAQGALANSSGVFYLPLPLARALAAGTPAPSDLKVQAATGRANWEAAYQNPPPAPSTTDSLSVRGVGTGGRAVGRVHVHHPGGRPASAGQILVAPTFLPSELPLLDAAALVTETGGPLDHVATQARERHLPAVVGAAGACRRFHDGDWVLVDADRGLVVRLGG